jgi:acetylglutamate kinase
MSAPSTIVVKLGGNLVAGEALAVAAADIAALARAGERVVVVHGGGPQASALQEKLGQTPRKVAGRRITDEATLAVMKMVVGGQLNVDLCSALMAAGARPVGLHGASAGVIAARRRPPSVIHGGPPEPVDLGLVGDVVGVNRELLALLVDHGYLPVLACLGADRDGTVYNINADVVASDVAVALGASALVFASHDVPGVLADRHDPATRIATITEAESHALVAEGKVVDGMIPKLEESFVAIRRGVRRIHIVGSLAPGDLQRELASPGSVGTALLP